MQSTIKIIVNGESRTVDSQLTLRDLVEQLGLGSAAVAAEVNKQVIPRRDHDSTAIASGDRIELVTLVGGG
ncbi:MAG: sulfur carrier protein ThiS [Planctomycetota bacterium]